MLIKAFNYFALLSGFSASASILTTVPAEGNYILNDIDGIVGKPGQKIEVVSNVPVNLNKYFGGGGLSSTSEPLSDGEVKVLVTSNCDTSQHNFAANVEIDSTTGTITVQVGEEDEVNVSGEMPFLSPSSFDAAWTMSDQWCEFEQSQSQTTLATELPAISDGGCAVCTNPKSGECELSVSNCFIDPCDNQDACPDGETCTANYCGGCHAICSGDGAVTKPPTTVAASSNLDGSSEVCEIGAKCSVEGNTCATGKETCCGKTYDSFQCTCVDVGGGQLQYEQCLFTDACFYPPCCQAGPPKDQPPPSPGTCDSGMGFPCDTGVADDYCCNDFESGGTYCTVTGGAPQTSQTIVVVTTEAPGTTESTTTSTTTQTSATTASTTTTPVTTASTTTTPATDETPNNKTDPNAFNGNSAAFTQQRCFVASCLVVALVSLLFPGQSVFGFGAVAVTAVALVSVAPKKDRNARKASHQTRVLQPTCAFNVEVLYDGCAHSVSVDAPAARVMDVKTENFTSTSLEDCKTAYGLTLTFVTDKTQELDLPANNTVDQLSEWSMQCAIIAIGRPFIDSSGEALKAMSIVPVEKESDCLASLSWSAEVAFDEEMSSSDNTTLQNRFLLGEEWTERSLGEHASVASFAAFAIALMTNNAPSDLVEDAFTAGMDEIRHARTSFEIASKLKGEIVGPGPLPASKHDFGHDLTSLALAVAREGCVDETLSAIVADLEVEDIRKVIEEGSQGSIYSRVESDTLNWIMNEMHTIADEESSHAALAWRTLNWVCGIDSDACDAVHREVFSKASLESRFDHRALSALSDTAMVRVKLEDGWMKIHDTHMLVQS